NPLIYIACKFQIVTRHRRRWETRNLTKSNLHEATTSEIPNRKKVEFNKKSKKSKKKMKLASTKENISCLVKMNKVEEEEDVYEISSGDEDCSRGMKKLVTNYCESRPGLDELQKRIDDFMTAHEERLEQGKQEIEAKASEGGWTVVVHHKGRKKTTDAESGTAVGSVSRAALEDKLAKKKQTEIVGHRFYRFQRRDAQRSELLALQSKFEEDKKRIQQLGAARKFKPY
uniref:Ribosomal RNA-processing protein 7 C-terminal domain-containing protein n=2 Tax=Brassica oleracea var. oleracea TaxID=109376 RepID=A0A0D3CSY0_BRAOL